MKVGRAMRSRTGLAAWLFNRTVNERLALLESLEDAKLSLCLVGTMLSVHAHVRAVEVKSDILVFDYFLVQIRACCWFTGLREITVEWWDMLTWFWVQYL